MKKISVKAAVVLLMAAGSMLPVYAQRNGDDHGRGRQERGAQRSQGQREHGRVQGPSRQNVQPQRRQEFRPQNDHRNDRRSWSQRGGYRGYVIPQNRFRASFGRSHYFRIGRPVIYEGRPRFAYGGYSFFLADPWPVNWGANWYDSDEVYVDYVNDGYYLYNRRHPGIGLSLNIGF